ASGGIDSGSLQRTVRQVATAAEAGYKPLLVSSGAVAAGLPALRLTTRPTDVPGLQAAAAVGQGLLMHDYAAAFAEHGLVVGQVLLTRDVLANRTQYLHAREAIARMLELGVVPIVNENDTVTVDELRFGDNDRLAALVCHLVEAAILIILTDTGGLFSDDPRANESAELLSAVRHNDSILDDLYHATTRGVFGSGGVATKIAAARMAAWSGVPTVIADASATDAVGLSLRGEEVGTWIAPRPSGLSARKLWIAFGVPSRGELIIDDGAAEAIAVNGRSLLAVGIREIGGDFVAGDAVVVNDAQGNTIAKGLVRLGSSSVKEVAGKHSELAGGAVIHRDDLVVLV
ncbi:MAG: glutamate 5-kinase, partial [Acidimicrobiia bacterium]